MRAILGAVFVFLFVGSLICGVMMGGPPDVLFDFSDLIVGVGGSLLFLSLFVMLALVLGLGSTGQKRSLWRLPLLCLAVSLIGFIFGVAVLTAKLDNATPQHEAMNFRLMIYAGVMILFALFSGLCLILAYVLAKYHNGKLPG